ncbi:MAG: hypothetical protein ABNH53_05985 [Henriciella sp.]|jgi:hypothetical protein
MREEVGLKYIVQLVAALLLSCIVPPALSQTFSPEQRRVISAFPTEIGDLDWENIFSRVDAENASELEFREHYLGALNALRSGKKDLAAALSLTLPEKSSSALEDERASLLLAFLGFYLSTSETRLNAGSELIVKLEDHIALSLEPDWLTGTSVSVLIEQATIDNDVELAIEAVDLGREIFLRDKNLNTQLWLVGADLKLAYAASLDADPSQAPNDFFARGALLIDRTYTPELALEDIKRLKACYLRIHTLSSAMMARDEGYDGHALPQLDYFHPEFQVQCVVSLEDSAERFIVRSTVKLGGVMLRVRLSPKGRAKFLSVEDAEPLNLADKSMHRYYRQFSKSLRYKIDTSNPNCVDGGEALVSYGIGRGDD